MKKIISTLVVLLAVVFFGTLNVNAMTEQELKDKFTKTYVIGNEEVKLDSDTKALMERYLDQYEVSSDDCLFISERFDTLLGILRSEETSKPSKLSQGSKQEIKDLVSEIDSGTSLRASVDKNGLVLYTPDGTTKEEFAKLGDELVRYTGNNNGIIIIIAGVISVIGIATLTYKKING